MTPQFLPPRAPDGSAWRTCPECKHDTLHSFYVSAASSDGDVDPAARCFNPECGYLY